MEIKVLRRFEDADANSLKIELFRDRDLIVRAWYIGPLIRTANGFVLAFASREQNLRAEPAVVRAVEIALAADLSVVLIDPQNLWDELWVGRSDADRSAASLDFRAKDQRREGRRHDLLVARDVRAAEPRREHDRGISLQVRHPGGTRL